MSIEWGRTYGYMARYLPSCTFCVKSRIDESSTKKESERWEILHKEKRSKDRKLFGDQRDKKNNNENNVGEQVKLNEYSR
jgi:hypothetical protein